MTLTADGKTAFVAFGTTLAVYNLENPREAIELAHLALGDIPTGLIERDGWLFVAANDAGIAILDVHRPDEPRRLADLSPTAAGVALVGNTLLSIDPDAGLAIFDITDPSHPELMHTAPQWSGDKIAASGNLIALSKGDKITFIDVSSPSQPRWIDQVANGIPVIGLFGVGDRIGSMNEGEVQIWQVTAEGKAVVEARHENEGPIAAAAAGPGLIVVMSQGDKIALLDARQAGKLERFQSYETYGAYGISIACAYGVGRLVCGTADGRLMIGDIDGAFQGRGAKKLGTLATDPPLREVAVAGRVAAAVVPGGVQFYDLRPSSAPSSAGRVDIAVGEGARLTASGGAVVAVNHDLWVIDAADPMQPRVARMLDLSEDIALASMDEAHLVVVTGGAELLLYDAKGAPTRTPLGRLALSGAPFALAIEPGRAYMQSSTGLAVVDTSDSSRPRLLALVTDVPRMESPHSLAVRGGIVFLYDGASPQVFDLRDPLHPRYLDRYSAIGGDRGSLPSIRLHDHFLYWMTGRSLVIADVYNPERPLIAEFVHVDVSPTSLAVGDGRVVLATKSGFDAWDVSSPAQVIVAEKDRPVYAWPAESVSIGPGTALVSDGERMRVLDLSVPTAPRQVALIESQQERYPGIYQTPAVSHAAWSGQEAFFVDGMSLRAVDLSQPAQPRSLGAAPINQLSTALAVSDGLAHVTFGDAFLVTAPPPMVFDVQGAMSPTLVARLDGLPATLSAVAVGRFGYYGTEARVFPWDLRLPAAPKPMMSLPIGGKLSLDSRGRRLFAVSGGALQLIDVEDPSAPKPRGQLSGDFGKIGGDVVAMGDRLVVGGAGGLALVDASQPQAIQRVQVQGRPARFYATGLDVGRRATLAEAVHLAAWQNVIYVADSAGGLVVVGLDDLPVPPPSSGRVYLPEARR